MNKPAESKRSSSILGAGAGSVGSAGPNSRVRRQSEAISNSKQPIVKIELGQPARQGLGAMIAWIAEQIALEILEGGEL